MIYNLNYNLKSNTPEWSDTLMFIDFDGTIIKTYDNSRIQSLSGLPSLPDHTGDDIPLISQGWNWTLAEIKSYNLLYPNTPITVGPLYYTADGKTHVLYDLNDIDASDGYIHIEGLVEIDWLDGTVETVQDSTVSHTLTGNHYTIKPLDTAGYEVSFGSAIKHIRCGRYMKKFEAPYGAYVQGFPERYNGLCLSTISTSPDINCMEVIHYRDLRVVILPYYNTAYTEKPSYIFSNVWHTGQLRAVASSYMRTLPTSWDGRFTIDGDYCCRFTVPDNVGTIEGIGVGSGTSLKSDIALHGMRRISDVAIHFAYGKKITLDDTLERVNWIIYLDNTTTVIFKGTTPPSWYGYHNQPFIDSPGAIYVPYSSDHSVLNAYKTTAPWDRYASLIQESPQ